MITDFSSHQTHPHLSTRLSEATSVPAKHTSRPYRIRSSMLGGARLIHSAWDTEIRWWPSLMSRKRWRWSRSSCNRCMVFHTEVIQLCLSSSRMLRTSKTAWEVDKCQVAAFRMPSTTCSSQRPSSFSNTRKKSCATPSYESNSRTESFPKWATELKHFLFLSFLCCSKSLLNSLEIFMRSSVSVILFPPRIKECIILKTKVEVSPKKTKSWLELI